jgi:hypothetical protein
MATESAVSWNSSVWQIDTGILEECTVSILSASSLKVEIVCFLQSVTPVNTAVSMQKMRG